MIRSLRVLVLTMLGTLAVVATLSNPPLAVSPHADAGAIAAPINEPLDGAALPAACAADDAAFSPAAPSGLGAVEACSPPPQCFSNGDCDAVCGKNNGVCVRINSCYRACACAS